MPGERAPRPETTALLECLADALKTAEGDAAGTANFLMIVRVAEFDKIALAEGLEFALAVPVKLADQFRRHLQAKDNVLRLTDRDLALVLPRMPNRAMVSLVVHKLNHIVERFAGDRSGRLPLRIHVGVAIFPEQGRNAADILDHAFVAMLEAAKRCAAHAEYRPETELHFRHELDIESALEDAIARDEFQLVFQPQINLQTGVLTGAEVLLRWNNPILGPISPDRFIPLAESNGAIIEITEWLVQKSLNIFRGLETSRHPMLELGINLSPASLRATGFQEFLGNCLDLWNFPPERLVLEITEGAMIDNPQQALTVLRELKDLGVTLAIDDFGTGYSSLQYLSKLPIDQIKIDQTFLRDVDAWRRNQKIVKAIVSLAEHFDLDVVAEGVEDRNLLEFLQGIGCRKAQGYLIARPMSAEAFVGFAAGFDPMDWIGGIGKRTPQGSGVLPL